MIHGFRPDILVVQEMNSQTGTTQFLDSVMNRYTPGQYATIPFHDGPDTDNELYYRLNRITFLAATYIATALRDIAHYQVRATPSSEVLHIYSVHLKASTGSTNEALRLAEATILRDSLNSLPAGSHFLVVGDYNIYKSSEAAFQKLVGSDVNNNGRCFDPLNLVGTWNNTASFAPYHTQSSRVRSFDGGATGGLDDRFDIILTSTSMQSRILTSTYTPYGNDSNHFNDSINRLPNSAVPDSIAIALHNASDHLPVFANFRFETTVLPIQLSYFTGTLNGSTGSVDLSWGTLSEVNNYGFEVQKKPVVAPEFTTIQNSFIPGHGTTVEPQYYRFTDSSTVPGSWHYRLKQIDLDGSIHYLEAILIENPLHVPTPSEYTFSLAQNFPNPFNPETQISFTLQSEELVRVSVYSLLGQEIRVLLNESRPAGQHSVVWNGKDSNDRTVSSGIYFYTLVAIPGNGNQIYADRKKMVLIR